MDNENVHVPEVSNKNLHAFSSDLPSHSLEFSFGGNLDSEIFDSHALSLPSEPPDIRIWFPSFNSESPEVDLSGDLESFFIHGEGEVDLERLKNTKCSDISNLSKRFSDESDKCGRFDNGSDQEISPANQDDHLDEIAEIPSSLVKFLSRKNDEDMRLTCAPSRHLDFIFMRKDENFTENNENPFISSKNGENKGFVNGEQSERECSRDYEVFSLKKNDNLRENNEISLNDDPLSWKGTKKSSEKENLVNKLLSSSRKSGDNSVESERKCFRYCDFISLKNNERSKENQGNGDEYLRNSGLFLPENRWKTGQATEGEKKLSAELGFQVSRRTLSEKTNLLSVSQPEVAGKWRCPRKGKSYLGPPLKQLRLERWVHRV